MAGMFSRRGFWEPCGVWHPKTPLGLDRDVFIDERPARLGVALGADRVLVGRGLHVVGQEGAVHVVAIAARDQAFVHLVVERHVERRLSVGVALEAERRLRSLQQVSSSLLW